MRNNEIFVINLTCYSSFSRVFAMFTIQKHKIVYFTFQIFMKCAFWASPYLIIMKHIQTYYIHKKKEKKQQHENDKKQNKRSGFSDRHQMKNGWTIHGKVRQVDVIKEHFYHFNQMFLFLFSFRLIHLNVLAIVNSLRTCTYTNALYYLLKYNVSLVLCDRVLHQTNMLRFSENMLYFCRYIMLLCCVYVYSMWHVHIAAEQKYFCCHKKVARKITTYISCRITLFFPLYILFVLCFRFIYSPFDIICTYHTKGILMSCVSTSTAHVFKYKYVYVGCQSWWFYGNGWYRTYMCILIFMLVMYLIDSVLVLNGRDESVLSRYFH